MHAVSPQHTTHVKRGTRPQQSGEDELMRLTDEIAEQEDVPHDYAYRLAQLRLANVKGGT